LLIEKHKNVFFVYLALYYLTIFQKTAWYLFAIWREITSKAARFLENGKLPRRFPKNGGVIFRLTENYLTVFWKTAR